MSSSSSSAPSVSNYRSFGIYRFIVFAIRNGGSRREEEKPEALLWTGVFHLPWVARQKERREKSSSAYMSFFLS